MAPRPIRLHPEAVVEARSARLWYSNRNVKASYAFMLELGHALKQIAEAPNRWPAFEHGTRRYLLKRFPYALVYRASQEAVEVLAVAHSKKRPGYWKDRV